MAKFEWVPSVPAKIDDPVDLTGFTSNILNSLKPSSLLVNDREIVAMELKPDKQVNTSVR